MTISRSTYTSNQQSTLQRPNRTQRNATKRNELPKMRSSLTFSVFAFILISSTIPSVQGQPFKLLSPFSTALETLQKQIGYTFKHVDFLRRAMTHASFSEENNKALSILGGSVIETAVSFHLLSKDIDYSAKELNHRLSEISNVDSSCAVDGMRLGLHKVIRVSAKTNSSTPSVVCGAFRAMFGAIAVDTAHTDAAGNVFWTLHDRDLGGVLAI